MIESTFSDKIVLYSNIGAIHVAMNTTELVIKIRPGKIQAHMEFESMTSVIPVHCSIS